MTSNLLVRRAGAWVGTIAAMSLASAAMAADQPTKVWNGKVAPLATPWTASVSPKNALPD